jgi:hypothetical protein
MTSKQISLPKKGTDRALSGTSPGLYFRAAVNTQKSFGIGAIAVVLLLFVTGATARMPPPVYTPPAPILNPSSPLVVPDLRQSQMLNRKICAM